VHRAPRRGAVGTPTTASEPCVFGNSHAAQEPPELSRVTTRDAIATPMPDDDPPILCLNCNWPMVLDWRVPRRAGEPDIRVWRCDYCRTMETKAKPVKTPA
jgi:hypothetical protein